MKNVSVLLLGATLLTAVGCGNNDSGSSKKRPVVAQDPIVTEDGHYQATLAPINTHLSDVAGTALVKVKGDSFVVEMRVNGTSGSTVHVQNIHVAAECPTTVHDLNSDGVIDAVEGAKAYGKILMPLDNNLGTLVEADAKFPTSDFSGNYFYKQEAGLDALTKELSSKLKLEGKQVVVYGVSKDTVLPDSVAALDGSTKNSSLPVACGTLIKIAVDDEGTNTSGGKEE